jgi:uncharacterized membrane protein
MGLSLKRRWRISGFWFVFGLAWFIIHAFVIFPILRHAPNGLPIHAVRYDWIIHGNLQSMIAYVFSSDSVLKLEFLFKLFAPVAFVSLFAPEPLLIAIPTFALSLLSSYGPQFDIYQHYSPAIIPAVLVSAVYGANKLQRRLIRRSQQDSSPFASRRLFSVMLVAMVIMWLIDNPFFKQPAPTSIFGLDSGADLAALHEVENIIPKDACVVASNQIQPHYSVRPETYVIGARGDMDGCTYMIVDMNDRRHNDFTDDQEVVCTQFWANKRQPVYFRDSVVVLQQMPVTPDPQAQHDLGVYCGHVADELRKRS